MNNTFISKQGSILPKASKFLVIIVKATVYKLSSKMYNKSHLKRFRNVPLALTRSRRSNSIAKKEDVEWKISRRIESREKKKMKHKAGRSMLISSNLSRLRKRTFLS